MSTRATEPTIDWRSVRDRLRSRGQRWTSQRRVLVDILAATSGHVTGADLVDRCRERDPATVPSTIYRTLDVLEDLGFIRHAHGPDGREEYHALPASDHGHLHCGSCGRSWELSADEAAPLRTTLAESRGFVLDLSHLSVGGRCASCLATEREAAHGRDRRGVADSS